MHLSEIIVRESAYSAIEMLVTYLTSKAAKTLVESLRYKPNEYVRAAESVQPG